ncbi:MULTISPECIES: carbonic anhydrase [unclassified Hyphomonas]|uniref:carbonic anhydrase n=1 Tax=unclassified Hyphomonas TaxID=2630699 RepID=UPI000458CD1C|nr:MULTISPECIES: carbonic anhydrase [unclassified Hyphomonas]KCZ46684.1 carbonic anhydrase [Hyphomonas sp. CY54-11-8]
MIRTLLENNMHWASARVRAEPDFFRRLSAQQAPEYLWIGCSDSRVPANEIVGLDPGELFVHRNIANLAPPRDMNFLAVLQFSIEVLKVRHVIVCGHYGCGGVRAALDSQRRGLIDHWLQPVADLAHRHEDHLQEIADFDTRVNVACEHNVRAQVEYLGHNPFVTDAWRRNQKLTIHGWIYSIRDGLLRDLDLTVERPRDVDRLSSRAWFPNG